MFTEALGFLGGLGEGTRHRPPLEETGVEILVALFVDSLDLAENVVAHLTLRLDFREV